MFDISTLERYPTDAGVYLMLNKDRQVIYVGKAVNLRQRLRSYFQKGGDTREMIPYLQQEIAAIDTIVVNTEKEALLLENTLIKKHHPKYNILLKDDKDFLAIAIDTKEKWPILKLQRARQTKQGHQQFFGPFPSAHAARSLFELLQKLFPLRQCSNAEFLRRTRPCLLYDMKRCIAPCVGKCTEEEYQFFVKSAMDFLKGDHRTFLKKLHADMEKASENLEFEKAGAILRSIRQIEELLMTEQNVVQLKGEDCDAIGFYRTADSGAISILQFRNGALVGAQSVLFEHAFEEDNGLLESVLIQYYSPKDPPPVIITHVEVEKKDPIVEILEERKKKKVSFVFPNRGEKKSLLDMAIRNAKSVFERLKSDEDMQEKILQDLQDQLDLARFPEVIECFDISHFSGSQTVASKVVFVSGKVDRKQIRHYHIKTAKEGDDYEAMREVLTRRLSKAKADGNFPDLIIVDGGKGQLSSALEVFHNLEVVTVDLIALTKEEGRHDKGMTGEKVYLPLQKEPILLSKRSPSLYLLQKIRDESHKSALRFQTQQRSKTLTTSSLDAIPGIGPIKKRRLLETFKSIEQLRKASDEDILRVKGINTGDLKKIRAYFASNS